MMQIYGFWRSAAMFRVRVALNIKEIEAHEIPVNLDMDAQHDPTFLAINPQGAVPAIVEEGHTPITQSMAILEYIEELHPDPPLLPATPRERARVRSLALVIAADTHPLIVPRVRTYLINNAGYDQDGVKRWIGHFVDSGLQTIERRLVADAETGRFCHGDSVTFADLCLVSAVNIVDHMKLDVRPTPTVARITAACREMVAFQRAHPSRQSDFPAG